MMKPGLRASHVVIIQIAHYLRAVLRGGVGLSVGSAQTALVTRAVMKEFVMNDQGSVALMKCALHFKRSVTCSSACASHLIVSHQLGG